MQETAKDRRRAVTMDNAYYSRLYGTAILVESARQSGEWRDRPDVTLKHSAGGALAEIEFPGGGLGGGTLDNLLPLDGVVGTTRVVVGRRNFAFTTASGAHPG